MLQFIVDTGQAASGNGMPSQLQEVGQHLVSVLRQDRLGVKLQSHDQVALDGARP